MDDRPILPAGRVRSFFRNPGGRIFALWLLLIAMFLTIWWALQPSGGVSGQAYDGGASDSVARSSSNPFIVVPLFGLSIASFIFFVVATRRFNSASSVGLQALAEGDFARAEAEFDSLTKRFRWLGALSVAARFNLALARLCGGKLDDAIERFGVFEKQSGLATIAVRPSTACHLAIAYALRGQLDVARTWLTEAEKRAEKSPHKAALTGLVAFGQAIVEVREGRDQEVLGWLEPRWRGLQGSLTGGTMRSFTVLRAFATARAGGEREIGAAERILHGLDPVRPGEFAMLEAAWPEMQHFLHR